VTGKQRSAIARLLPRTMSVWGRFRIRGGGDSFRTAVSTRGKERLTYRNSSYNRFEILYEADENSASAAATVRQVGYGLLETILVCILPDHPTFGHLRGCLRLLVVIEPCKTHGKDATSELTMYNEMAASIVTDIQNVKAVVGRVKTRGKWGIVDRTAGIASTVFYDADSDLDSDDD